MLFKVLLNTNLSNFSTTKPSSVGIDPLYSRHEVGAWCDYLLKPLPPPSQPSEILNQPPPQINLLPHELLPLPKTTNKQQQQSSFSSSHHLVTFVSQLSIDRLPILERSLQTWTGPVSLAIYIPLKGSSTQGDLRDQESASTILDWQRLYINKKIAALGGNISLGESTVALVPGTEGAVYPINALRNLAMSAVRTRFAFLVDADFQPSPGLEAHFAAYLQRKELGKKVGKEEEVEKVAYVVPAFEYLETPNVSVCPKQKTPYQPLSKPYLFLPLARRPHHQEQGRTDSASPPRGAHRAAFS